MVLLYMVLHGSHQYTPNVSIYTSTMDPMGMTLLVSMAVLDKMYDDHDDPEFRVELCL